MCQLMLYKTSVRRTIQPIVLAQMLVNSAFRNTDGAGLYSTSNGIVKTHLAFKECMWSNAFKNSTDTILGHVRAATTSGSGKKEISIDNSHPFYVNGIVLAHNGSLEYKKDFKPTVEILPEETDSKIFLKELARRMTSGVTLPDALKVTMETFTGKFAFLIHTAADDSYYVVRGRTAPLYKCLFKVDNKPIGLLINTEEASLKTNLHFYLSYYQTLLGKSVDVTVTEVKQETINIVKDYDIEEVAEIKENIAEAKPVAVVIDREPYEYRNGNFYENYEWVNNAWKKKPESTLKDSFLNKNILEGLVDIRVSYNEFDVFSNALLKKPATSLSKAELINLGTFVISLTSLYDKESPSIQTQKERLVNICRRYVTTPLEFPYYLNEIKDLLDIVEREGINDIYKPNVL